jgi:hypothetical protein
MTSRERCSCGAFLTHEADWVGDSLDGEVVYCKRCEGSSNVYIRGEAH